MKLRKCTLPNQSVCFLQDQLNQLPTAIGDKFLAASSAELDAFYRFAGALGCFSRDQYVDEDGNATKTVLGQKASTVLRQLLADGYHAADKSDRLRIGDFATLFPDLPENCPPNPRLLDFVGHTAQLGDSVQYSYLTTLLSLERDAKEPLSGLFQKVVMDFPKAYRFMQTTEDASFTANLLVTDGLTRFYYAPSKPNYRGMTHRTRELGFLCASYGLEQKIFDQAVVAFNIARSQQTPHHILGTTVGEPVGSADFTFEMLDKRDPVNAVLGILCNCCATIGSPYYGADLAKVAIYDRDAQNMVVRNRLGEIVAKGTLRLLSRRAQAAFNTLQVNERYRRQKHQKQNQNMDAIFDAFMRGVDAVVTAYDEKHPERPLQIVTVGMGNNHFNEQCLRYPYAKVAERVDGSDYFYDAKTIAGQCVLYRAGGLTRQSAMDTPELSR